MTHQRVDREETPEAATAEESFGAEVSGRPNQGSAQPLDNAPAATDAVVEANETKSTETSPLEDAVAGDTADADTDAATSEAPAPAEAVNPLPAMRQALLQRVQDSVAMPRGLQSRLASALQESPLVDHDGSLLAPVDLLLNVIEGWSPSVMRLDPQSLRRGDHPLGDSFFTGDPSEVSDEQAERIARQQLQRSGYLPRGTGQ